MENPQSFRNPYSNARYTKQMFYELWNELPKTERTVQPRYCLMHAQKGLPSFRKIYVELGDPSGYELAIRYLEDYDHWRLLMKATWFRAAKELWDEELDAKLSAEGMATIRLLAAGGEDVPVATQLTAAKYLADKTFRKVTKTPSLRGRPSKAEVEGNLRTETQSAKDIADDLARIRKAS